jgi:hypothetical protein
VRLAFPSEGNRLYRVEISDDGNGEWKLISDQTQNTSRKKMQTLSAANSVSGRFLRVTFVGKQDVKSTEIAEVEVAGSLTGQ